MLKLKTTGIDPPVRDRNQPGVKSISALLISQLISETMITETLMSFFNISASMMSALKLTWPTVLPAATACSISIVPASMQRMNMDGVSYRPLKGAPQAKAQLTIASRRREPSVVVRNFLHLVRRAAKDFEQPNRSHS